MTGVRRLLSQATSAMLVRSIETHVTLAAMCRRQGAELAETEGEVVESQALALAQVRATHELERATHCAALTSIGCTIATLEALGYEVAALATIQNEAEDRERKKDEAPAEDEPES